MYFSYINLGKCYDHNGMEGLRTAIISCMRGYKGHYQRAYRCLDAAAELMYDVRSTLDSDALEEGVLAPVNAVQYTDEGTVLFVQADSRPDNAVDLETPVEGVPEGFWAVPVETGISDTYNVEIKSGVEEGAVVFTQVQTESSWM